MSVPFPFNATCDLYHVGTVPPAAPHIAGLRIHLTSNYRMGLEGGEGTGAGGFNPTHIVLVETATDIRDPYGTGAVITVSNGDRLYIPDKTAAFYLQVLFVERRNWNKATDHKRAFCMRMPGPET